MRQIRPRSTYFPTELPRPVPTGITLDLRENTPSSASTEDRLRERIQKVRDAISMHMDELSALVDQRETLKSQLGALAGVSEDRSIVAWGFCEDDDL